MELSESEYRKRGSRSIAARVALAVFAISGILVVFDRYTDNYLKPLLWMSLCAVAVYTALNFGKRGLGDAASGLFARSEGWLLTVLAGWLVLSAIVSDRPDISRPLFLSEAGIYIPLALCWLFWSSRCPKLQDDFKRIGVLVLALGVCVGFVAGVVYILGTPGLREWMESSEHHASTFIRRENPTVTHSVWRLNFPFGHHNRMAYFSMVSSLVALWICVAGRLGCIARMAWFGCAAMSLGNLGMTLNRGAWGAFLIGAAIMTALRLGRRALWVLLVLPLVFIVLPDAQKERLVRLTLPYTYTNPGSTINLRFGHWAVALEMIKTDPVLGVGYGYKNFENYYPKIAVDKFGWHEFEDVHAHNIWLQVGAESGIPAVALFFAWNLLRWSVLVRLWKRRASLKAQDVWLLILWIGLESAIQAYCLVNLPLRRSLGVLTWGIWILMTADLVRMLNESSVGKNVTADNADVADKREELNAGPSAA